MSIDLTRRRLIVTGAAAASLPLLGTQASAQAWPSKPVRVIAGYPAGGQTDLFARTYGDYLAQKLGQPFIVENKPGAGGTVAAVETKRAAPDGYTMMFTISTTMIMNRALYKSVPYDADKDFTLLSIMPAGSICFAVGTKTGATNLKEFVDYAKKSGKVSLGTYAAGSYAHMVIAELNKQYGLNIEAVHYRGEAPMWTDVMSGAIDGGNGSYNGVLPVLQANKGKVIAVHRKRMSRLPDVPTFQEQGAVSKVYDLTGFQCAVVPAGTPQEIVKRLSSLLVEAGKGEKVQEMVQRYGIDETALDMETTQELYDREKPIWLELVKNLNLTPE
jgi:tripartite-type tricarboxylate transporter receptor subunit TctC